MKGEKQKRIGTKSKTRVNSDDVRVPDIDEAGAVERFLRLLAITPSSTNPDGVKSEINSDTIKKVNQGTLGEVLRFLAEHMRGREEVRRARCQIQAAISTRSGREGFNAEFHPRLVELEKVRRRLRAARTAVDVARNEREEERKRHETLQKERHELEDKAWKERELGVFLDVLETRETVRLKRIEEVRRMVNQLRKEVENTRRSSNVRRPVGSVEMALPRWRPKFTKETVAKLHAHHIRLKTDRLSGARTRIEATKQAEERLRGIIQSRLQVELPDNELRRILATCKSAADVRARQKVVFAAPGRVVDKDKLQRELEEVRNKEGKIMALNEAITAKMYLVGGYLQMVKVFREQSTEMIRKSLKENEEEAKGYIEAARRNLTQINTRAEDRDGFPENNASSSERLERGLEQCHAVEEMMRKLSTVGLSQQGREITLAYQRSTKEVEERTGKMLERKMAKAKVGLEIAEEVGVLVGEAGRLTM